MMVSGIPQCHSCGEPADLSADGEVLVACHECNLPVCRPCFDYENAEGGQSCLRCGTPYIRPSGFLSIHFFYYAIGLFLFIFFTCCATVSKDKCSSFMFDDMHYSFASIWKTFCRARIY